MGGGDSTPVNRAGASGPVMAPDAPARSPFKVAIRPKLRKRRAHEQAGTPDGTLPAGTLWDVRIIESGTSLNGFDYTDAALRGGVQVFEGVPVYAHQWGDPLGGKGTIDHRTDPAAIKLARATADPVGNLVGKLEGVRYTPAQEGGPSALDATLRVSDPRAREVMLGALDVGALGDQAARQMFGLSIDAQVMGPEGTRTVEAFTSAASVDVVTAPAAGGRIRRLVAALTEDEMTASHATPSLAPNSMGATIIPTVAIATQASVPAPAAPAPGSVLAPLAGPFAAAIAPAREAAAPAPAGATSTAEAMPPVPGGAAAPTGGMPPGGRAKLAQTIKALAERLANATDADMGQVLAAIQREIQAADVKPAAEQVAGACAPEEDEMNEAARKIVTESLQRIAAGGMSAQESVRVCESIATATGVTFKAQEADKRDQTIAQLRESMNRMAMTRHVEGIGRKMGIRESAIPDVMKLADLTGVKVSEDGQQVTGLQEAIEAVLASRDYLREPAPAAPAAPALGGAQASAAPAPALPAAAPAPAAKPAAPAAPATKPIGQAVPVRESDPTGGFTPMSEERYRSEFGRLRDRTLNGDMQAATDLRKLRKAREAGTV